MAPLARRIRNTIPAAAPVSGGDGNAALALAYADRGVRVFPCREDRFGPSEEHPKGDPEAKAPYPGVMWQGSEPGKRTSIEAWWRRWSGALIGVGLGDRNLLVIDVDGGADAVALWEAYADDNGGLPDGVPYVNTPTGGRHYFFRLPDGVKHGNGRGRLPKKAELPVDVRGTERGYVIAAGTERPYWGRYEPHDGDPFSWLDAPEIPAWLLDVLKGEREHHDEPQAKLPAIVPSTPVTIENERVRAWAEAAFEAEITAVASCGEGGRNNQLNASAFALGTLVGGGFLGESQVRSALEQAARDCGVWRDDGPAQCRKTINSGISKGKRDPRPIPADIIEDEAEAEEGRAIRLRLAERWRSGKAAAAALVPHDPETGEVLDEPEPAPLPAKPEEEEFPEEWTYVPGLVGDITDWITATARRPNRAMSLAAAVAVVGTAMGRCWAGPTKSATHNYILTIARTGGGKDHPKQQAHTILETCGMNEQVGPDGFTASTALTSLMLRTPVSLAAIDEFGTFLKRINGRRAGGFEKEISKVLRTAWGVNFKSMRTPEWAGRPSQTIYAPALTLMGTTTASEFFKSLEGGDIGNGFLNRFMLIYVTTKPQEVEPELPDNIVPDHIKQGIDDLWGCGNEDYRSTVFRSSADEVNPTIIPWEDEAAHAVYKLLGKTIELMGDEQPETVDFFARTAEMAVRLATIRAAGRFPYGPKVSVEDMEWGRDVAWWSARRMMECCALYMAETENQEWANTIKRIIRDAGGKMKKREMLRKLQHRLKARDLKDLLEAMQASGTIKVHPARPRTADKFAEPEMVELLDG